jgi:hypothetical protein
MDSTDASREKPVNRMKSALLLALTLAASPPPRRTEPLNGSKEEQTGFS